MIDVDKIEAWENGTQEPADTLEMFAELIRTGAAWTLQGSYGRTASDLIERGYLTQSGEVTESGKAATE